ncbi:MAG: flagellar basal body rod C-terminal domain-containing protein [Casimicrobiaceae bacterium]
MAAAQTRLDIAAENLSNLSTGGYHRREARGTLTFSGVSVAARTTNGRVDAVAEMIDVLGAQRAFEGAGKVVSAIDQQRQHAAEAARVR